MSSVYHTEPPTQGKVLIRTSYGDIDIELWSKEAPLACRNFIQLAMEGYFDKTLVVRVVKGFMVQMGDPTGTGQGGESIWGAPFKDEIHGRIKFNHRGQVAMANSNKPHSNQSQFFISLDNCDWLQGKHTIFGKVTGNTIFNVLRMGEVEVGSNDKPLEDIRILQVEVLWNPFDDIIPRIIEKPSENTTSKKLSKPTEVKAVKNKSLLSFQDDDDDEGNEDTLQIRFRSVHDASAESNKRKKSSSSRILEADAAVASVNNEEKPAALVSSNEALPSSATRALSSGKASVPESSSLGGSGGGSTDKAIASFPISRFPSRESDKRREEGEADSDDEDPDDFDRRMREKVTKERNKELLAMVSSRAGPADTIATGAFAARGADRGEDEGLDKESIQRQFDAARKENSLQQKSQEFIRLRDELLQSRRAVSVVTGEEALAARKEEAFQQMATPLEQRRMKFLQRKSNFGDRSDETMRKLEQFKSSLKSGKNQRASVSDSSYSAAAAAATATDIAASDATEAYHGQVLERDSGSEGEGDKKERLDDWFVGKLKFKKHIDDQYRNGGADGRRVEDYQVIDPKKLRK